MKRCRSSLDIDCFSRPSAPLGRVENERRIATCLALAEKRRHPYYAAAAYRLAQESGDEVAADAALALGAANYRPQPRIYGAGTMQPYYQDNLTTLYHGNCLDIMPQLEAQSFDAIICDPPFGTTSCAWDSVIPFDAMWANLKRLIKPKGAIVLFGSQPFTSLLITSNLPWFKYELIWDKERGNEPQMANIRPMKRHENIMVFCEGATAYHPQMRLLPEPDFRKARGARINRADGTGLSILSGSVNDQDTLYTARYPTSVLPFENGNQNNKAHPSQKSLPLMEYLVKTYTNEGDAVLDFCAGSGTTLRAAKNLKRRSVGIELLEEYCRVAVKRLAPAFEESLVDDTGTLDDLPLFAQEPTL